MIRSKSNQRTANNGVRSQYRVLTDKENVDMVAIQDAAEVFLLVIDTVASHYTPSEGPGRELALARTKVEEAAMWAVKGITK